MSTSPRTSHAAPGIQKTGLRNTVDNAPIIRKDRPFSVQEFARREPADLLGTAGFVTSAEDLILAKLEWANATGSERQLQDVAGIVAIRHSLDEDYIERWASVLGTNDAWHRARDAAR